MLPFALRNAYRAATYRAVRHAVGTNPRLANYQRRYHQLTPPEQQTFATLLNVTVHGLLLGWITGHLADTLRGLWAQPLPPAENAKPKETGDPRKLTVAKLVDMMAESEKHVVHRTPEMLPGTLRADMEARYPAGEHSDHATKGVYVAKGIRGFDYGPWGVVYKFDGRFTPYKSAEFVCLRTMTAAEAEGWYDLETLNAAIKIHDAKKAQR